MPKRLRPWLAYTVLPVEGGTTPPPAPTPAPPAPAVPATGANGFPESTPVKDMTVEQQAAYHLHQSRKHEDRSKEKDQKLADLQKQVEELKRGQMSDTDKALAEKIDAEVAKARLGFASDLVSARIEAAVAKRGIDVANVQPLIDALDVSKFLTTDGKPDAERITAWASALPEAPATGGTTPPSPGTGGFQGRGGGQTTGKRDAAADYKADKEKRAANPFT